MARQGLPPHLDAQRSFVRSQLRRYGVPSSSLDDLMQEVWIVSLVRGPVFAHENAVRGWLSQVCRRVAAHDRRSRARMLTFEHELELAVDPAQEQFVEDGVDQLQRRAALSRLTEKQLDVLTLYASGGASMREVARLVGAPEPTVYSWYRAAVEQVTGGLAQARQRPFPDSAEDAAALEQVLPLRALSREVQADHGEVVVYRHDRDATFARMGNVVVSRWRNRMAARTAAGLGRMLDLVGERMGSVVLLNDLRSEMPPPDASERKALRSSIQHHSEHVEMVVALNHITDMSSLVLTVEGTLAVTGIRTGFTMASSLEDVGERVAPLVRAKNRPLSWEHLLKNFAWLERLAS